MKIRTNYFELIDSKINLKKRLLQVNDIHSNSDSLEYLLKIAKKLAPDIILIPGDLLDYNNADNTIYEEWIKQLAAIAFVARSLGNHDLYDYDKKNKRWSYTSPDQIFGFNQEFKNNHLFKSNTETIKISPDLTLGAITMPITWYTKNANNKKEFLKEVRNLYTQLNSDQFNIVLSHSPNGLITNNKLDEFDSSKSVLYVAGHNHGGLLPVILQPLSPNNRGLLGSHTSLFPKNAFGYWTMGNSSLLLSNGVTKFVDTCEFGPTISKFLNQFFIPDVECIDLNPGLSHSLTLTKREINIYK